MKTPSLFKQLPQLPKIEVDETQVKKILSFTAFLLIVALAMWSSTLAQV